MIKVIKVNMATFLMTILGILLFITNISHAEHIWLKSIASNLSAPTAVAIDKNGSILVTESINNKLLIYSQSGAYMRALFNLSKPISVTVDNDLKIYIGNKNTGNVEVYDDDFNFLFKLGDGDGEFIQPGAIAIAIGSSGNIYVADSDQDIIKVYNSDGSYNSSFGSSGKGDGEFNFPTSIAIDENTEELIISDLQFTKDMFGGDIEGARIQVFNMNGEFKRSFGEYGIDEGQIVRPMGITVDKNSSIYVTDSQQHIVHVFNNEGVFLGNVYNIDNQMRTPLGVAISNGNRLYIASLTTGKIEVYGIDQYTNMSVAPLSLTFEGNALETPALQNVVISNSGTETLNWTATKSSDWITLSAASGTADLSDESTLNVGVDLSGLSSGDYSGSVTVSAASGDTEIVNIELTVSPAPVLSITPSFLEFTSINDSVPAAQSFSIANTGEGTLNWTAASNNDWISIDKETGTGAVTISVSVDPSSKNVDVYSGSITVSGESALSSPTAITVTFNVVELNGSINVTTNHSDATFTINGPESFSGSGVSASIAEAQTGMYTIVFGEVEGHTAPSSNTKTLETDSTISFTGQYVINEVVQQSTYKSIITGAGPAEFNNGLVKVFDMNGNATDVNFLAHEYEYGVNIATGDINNDGFDEIITAPGPGPDNPADVKIFDRNGDELTGLSIHAYDYTYGVNIASGDFNADGYYEVVTGTGHDTDNPAYVKIFIYDTTNNSMVDSGINLLAYDTRHGVNVTVGDIDNDGVPEIITVPGPGESNSGTVRIWEVDTSNGTGHWSASLSHEYTVTSRYGYSVNVAAGDINGDGYDELITGAGPDSRARDDIKVYGEYGSIISEFRAYIVRGYGANIGSGDMDGDGVAEIVVGSGSGPRNRAIVKTFNADGIEQARFRAFDSRYGVNVAIGDLGLE